MLATKCPSCGAVFTVRDEQAGKSLSCPKCNGLVATRPATRRVEPQPAAAEAAEDLAVPAGPPPRSPAGLRRELAFITIRQRFRTLCEKVHLGSSAGERVCVALIIGVVPFGLSFGLSLAMSQPALYAVIQGAASFLLTGAVCSMLAVGPSDERLEARRASILGDELPAALAIDRCRRLWKQDQEAKLKMLAESEERERERETEACPYCGEEIFAGVLKCKHCGEHLDADLRRRRAAELGMRGSRPSPGTAAILELVFGLFLGTFGIGHFYAGYVGNGLLALFGWWVFVALNVAATFLTCGVWGAIGIVLVPTCWFFMLIVSPITAASEASAG